MRRSRQPRPAPRPGRNVPALPFLPWQSLYIVICIDCRVDPFRGDDIGRRCSGEMP